MVKNGSTTSTKDKGRDEEIVEQEVHEESSSLITEGSHLSPSAVRTTALQGPAWLPNISALQNLMGSGQHTHQGRHACAGASARVGASTPFSANMVDELAGGRFNEEENSAASPSGCSSRPPLLGGALSLRQIKLGGGGRSRSIGIEAVATAPEAEIAGEASGGDGSAPGCASVLAATSRIVNERSRDGSESDTGTQSIGSAGEVDGTTSSVSQSSAFKGKGKTVESSSESVSPTPTSPQTPTECPERSTIKSITPTSSSRSGSLTVPAGIQDEEVARAYAAALSVAKLKPEQKHRITHAGATTDRNQKALIERHRKQAEEKEAVERAQALKIFKGHEEMQKVVQNQVKRMQHDWKLNREKLSQGFKIPIAARGHQQGQGGGDFVEKEKEEEDAEEEEQFQKEQEQEQEQSNAQEHQKEQKSPPPQQRLQADNNDDQDHDKLGGKAESELRAERECSARNYKGVTPFEATNVREKGQGNDGPEKKAIDRSSVQRHPSDFGNDSADGAVAAAAPVARINFDEKEGNAKSPAAPCQAAVDGSDDGGGGGGGGGRGLLNHLPAMPFLSGNATSVTGGGSMEAQAPAGGDRKKAMETQKSKMPTPTATPKSSPKSTSKLAPKATGGLIQDRCGRSMSAPPCPQNAADRALASPVGTRGTFRNGIKSSGTSGGPLGTLFGMRASSSTHQESGKMGEGSGGDDDCSSLADAAAVVDALAAITADPSVQAAQVGDMTVEDYEQESTMNQTVWKRRDGLGKLSLNNAWERRRLVLKDTKLIYFAEGDSDSSSARTIISQKPNNNGNTESKVASTSDASVQNKWQTSWRWDQAAAAVANNLAVNWGGVGNAAGPDCPSAGEQSLIPRGSLDVVKEQVSITVSTGGKQTGVPTPFALSINTRGETKWKFCFDTHKQQMDWLNALSNVVVRHSVEDFVEERAASGGGVRIACNLDGPYFALTQGPPTPDGSLAECKIAGGKSVLQHESTDGTLPHESSDDGLQQSETAAFEKVSKRRKSEVTESMIVPGRHLHVDGKSLDLILLVLFAALLGAYSTTTGVRFWFFFTCFNAAVWTCLKDEVDEEMKNTHTHHLKKELSIRTKASISPAALQEGPRGEEAETKGLVPVAGSSTIRLVDVEDVGPSETGQIQWRDVQGSDLKVRSLGYDKLKMKMPSLGTLYECTAVDVFSSSARVETIWDKVQLPCSQDCSGDLKKWHSPDIFIVSLQLPTEPPKLGWPVEDGEGMTIVAYFSIRNEIRRIRQIISEDDFDATQADTCLPDDIDPQKINAVRLWEKWCLRSPQDPSFQGRFKFIPMGVNVAEIGLPGYICKYNGKPVLIKRAGVTGTLHSHPDALEFVINLHAFPYLAKQAFSYMHENFFSKVVCNLGFVIEGRGDDELPEVVLGVFQLVYPDPTNVTNAESFLKGR